MMAILSEKAATLTALCTSHWLISLPATMQVVQLTAQPKLATAGSSETRHAFP